jgi:chemotaxis-related protein WspD
MSDRLEPETAGNLHDQTRGAQDTATCRLLDRPLTDDLLREATEQVAQPRSQPNGEVASALLFRIGCEHLAVPATDVDRVTRVSVVRRIPHRGNRIIRGLCNIDGELVLCGSLSGLLELPEEVHQAESAANVSDESRMVVLGPESNRWAVEVDCVLGLQHFETALCKSPPVTVRQAMRCFTTSLLPLSDDTVATLLDVSQVLSGFKAALT